MAQDLVPDPFEKQDDVVIFVIITQDLAESKK